MHEQSNVPVQMRPDPPLKHLRFLQIALVVHRMVPQEEADGCKGDGGVEEVKGGEGVAGLIGRDVWVVRGMGCVYM